MLVGRGGELREFFLQPDHEEFSWRQGRRALAGPKGGRGRRVVCQLRQAIHPEKNRERCHLEACGSKSDRNLS